MTADSRGQVRVLNERSRPLAFVESVSAARLLKQTEDKK